jgi:hypothetical protein
MASRIREAAKSFFGVSRADTSGAEGKKRSKARSGCLSKCFVAALGPDAVFTSILRWIFVRLNVIYWKRVCSQL